MADNKPTLHNLEDLSVKYGGLYEVYRRYLRRTLSEEEQAIVEVAVNPHDLLIAIACYLRP